MAVEQPDPVHQLSPLITPQEVYKGVPIIAYQDSHKPSNVYGIAVVWYGRQVEVGEAPQGKKLEQLFTDARDSIDLMVSVRDKGMLTEQGTLPINNTDLPDTQDE